MGDPYINRGLDFGDAKWSAREALFYLVSLKTEALEEEGVTTADTFPYWVDVLTASFYLDAMTRAYSPGLAGPHIHKAIVSIQELETAIPEAVYLPQKTGWKDKDFCDQLQWPR